MHPLLRVFKQFLEIKKDFTTHQMPFDLQVIEILYFILKKKK